MTVTLTPEQQQALSRGEDVSVTIDDTECVVIRKDVYQQTRDLRPDELYPAVLKAWDATGSHDDGDPYK